MRKKGRKNEKKRKEYRRKGLEENKGGRVEKKLKNGEKNFLKENKD